ncbi:MAG: twin-arginine translocase TatA/TatE family subunit [Propionibacteriales bacterium]|nr:twin-arginine translocase TatA/TatE family subunit [Propionibacteriales bacterium]
MFRQIGPTEILLILGVVLLLFGGRKLPELARGSGRALRIFKSEVKELKDDEKSPSERDDATIVHEGEVRPDTTLRSDQRRDGTSEQA